MNDHELLSKKQVMDQYGYPESQLDKDLKGGALPHFRLDQYGIGRLYIPRFAVEKRIHELAKMGASR